MSTGGGRGRLTPYLVGLPGGLWLAIFFVVPILVMLSLSLQSGNSEEGTTKKIASQRPPGSPTR